MLMLSEQEITSSVLNDASNLPQMVKMISETTYIKDHTNPNQANTQNGSKQLTASNPANKNTDKTVSQQLLQIR